MNETMKPNPSISGLTSSAQGQARPNQRGAMTDPVWSGDTGMDQSVRDYKTPVTVPGNVGNKLPGVPSITRGNS